MDAQRQFTLGCQLLDNIREYLDYEPQWNHAQWCLAIVQAIGILGTQKFKVTPAIAEEYCSLLEEFLKHERDAIWRLVDAEAKGAPFAPVLECLAEMEDIFNKIQTLCSQQ